MAMQFFLYIPQTDDEIINVALDTSKFIEKIKNIKEVSKNNQGIIYYDEENIKIFIDKVDKLNLVYLDSFKTQLRQSLGKTSISIHENSLRNNDFVYIIWSLNTFKVDYADDTLKEIAERIEQYPTEKFILFTFESDLETNKNTITIFKDAKHFPNYPQNFIHIPFVENIEELEIWLATHHIIDFSLLNKLRFRGTNQNQQGKKMYEEIETGNFWYLDNFHKNEYEVFNPQGQHIGVADLQGNVDISKAIKGRTID